MGGPVRREPGTRGGFRLEKLGLFANVGRWVGCTQDEAAANLSYQGDFQPDFEPQPGLINYCIFVVYCTQSMICLY
jgi:hypothetical protein